ncbi:hypothetical protein RD792_016233 [Penstemon davidsonii]|uniref:BHLH domain-containing protein n=1 Tax=Penstemon davidsonii TaxID=160366 RepID=A0ABR0CIQ9_9LAMI|nr:hypothetical protein RD792_016233 [Penstemon davidsonii]
MGDEQELGHGNMMWDEDQSWSFPILQGHEEDGSKIIISNIPKEEQAQAAEKKGTEKVPLALRLPPLPPKGKKRTVAARKGKGTAAAGESEHELHIWTERERRKKMRNMFTSLHALIPHLPPKADKATIVDEAVQYIKKLQQTLQNLRKRKLDNFRFRINNNNYKTNNYNNNNNSFINKLARGAAFLTEPGSTSTYHNMAAPAVTTLAKPNYINPNPIFTGPAVFKTWTSPNVILNICGKDAHISVCGPKKPGLLTAICFVLDKYKVEIVSAQVSSDRTRCMYMIHTRANGGSELFPLAFPVEEIHKQAAAEIMLWVNS